MTDKLKRMAAYNSTLAKGGVSSPLDSFAVAECSVLRNSFCAERQPIDNQQNVICNSMTTVLTMNGRTFKTNQTT